MRVKTAFALLAIFAAAAVLLAVSSRKNAIVAGELPPGHGIKCLKADGQTPCGDAELASLKSDIAGLKKLVHVGKTVTSDTKTAVSDTKSSVGDAQQGGDDGKQVGSDAKQVGADVKNKDLKQGVKDAKQAGGDAKTAKDDVKTAVGDPKQVVGDVQQVIQDLTGIGSISLKSPDGQMNCAQNDGSACNDSQTKALKTHAAQKKPSITVQREADQASN